MSHTKEPWRIDEYSRVKADGCNEFLGVQVDGFSLCGSKEAQYNTRWIVACVNACEGLTQDHFDGGWKAKELIAYAVNLEKERDALRELCGELVQVLRITESWLEGWASAESQLAQTRAAITKAESILGEKK